MRRATLFLALFITLAGCGNRDGAAPCGDGTVQLDRQCVPDETACGAGTVLDDDGRCVVAVPTMCGEGTQRDANTGACVATSEVCGENTAFDTATGMCRPTREVCLEGTVYSRDAGQCTPEARCRPGDVVLDGLCVPAAEALASDPDVEGTENDDPDFAGTPNPITLPAPGDRVVFVGTIDAPRDLDLDGERDQDVDVYEFEAESGEWVYVSLQPLGAPSLSYVVSGPPGSDFVRFSPLDGEASARGFVTTLPGRYRVFVAPTATILGQETSPLGAPNFRYVGTLETAEPPEPSPANVAAGVESSVGDPADNFFADPGFNPSTMGELTFEEWSSGVDAEVSLWDGDRFLASRRVSSSIDFPIAVPDTGTVQFLVDWVRVDGVERGYRVTGRQGVPLNQLGELDAGSVNDADAVELRGFESTWFAFTLQPGEVIELSQDNSTSAPVTVELLDAAGRLITDETLDPRPLATDNVYLYHPALLGGTFLVRARTASTVRAFSLRVSSVTPTPHDIAAGDGATDTQALMLPDRSHFALVRFADGDIAELSQTNQNGSRVPLRVWRPSWRTVAEELDLAARGSISTPKFAFRYQPASPLLVEYRNATAGDLRQVGIRFNGMTPAPLGQLDAGSEVAAQRGTLLARERRAFFGFDLPEELLLEGTVDAFGDDVDVFFRRPDSTLVFGASTNGGENFVTALPAGPFVVEVVAVSELADGFDFDMSVLGFPSVREVEPNNNFLDASTGLTPGGTIGGTYPNNGSNGDIFEFAADQSAFYSFSVLTFPANSPQVNLYNADGEVVLGMSLTPTERLTTFLEPGDYYLEVVGDGFATQDIDYVVRSSVASSDATVVDDENNDTPGTAIAATADIGLSIDGLIQGSRDVDYFRLTSAQSQEFYVFAAAPAGGFAPANLTFLDSTLSTISMVDTSVTLPAGASYLRVSEFRDLGPNDYRIRFTSAPNVYASAPDVAIPAGGWPQVVVREDITATQQCTVGQIWVDIDVEHTFIGDLYVTLTGPDGQSAELWTGRGGSRVDLAGTFPTTLQPTDDLGIFVGTEGAGDWTLEVGDQFVSDSGRLKTWGIRLFCQ